MSVSKAVLITGCSSGIGWATAERLANVGWRVYATARKVEAIAPLEESGCRLLSLDVTDDDSMVSAVEEVERREGAVGALVNNAGYSQSGAVEAVPMEKIRRQFETNVFGLVSMCQLALPGMRRQGYGRIVNVSSMGGKLTFPGGGYYHASKHAVEAISDALRFEVEGFGVKVSVLEPASSKPASRTRRRVDPRPKTAPTPASKRRWPRRPRRTTRGDRCSGSVEVPRRSPRKWRRLSPPAVPAAATL